MSTKLSTRNAGTTTFTCNLCGKALGKGYFYMCHVCGATYCYAHMPAKCSHVSPGVLRVPTA